MPNENTNTLPSFLQAERDSNRPKPIHEEVRKALRDPVCWNAIVIYVRSTGSAGSREFDHALTADAVLKWDREKNAGRIAGMALNHRKLWSVIARQLAHLYDLDNGYIVGVRTTLSAPEPTDETETETATSEA